MRTIQDAFREIGQTYLRLAEELSPQKGKAATEKRVSINDISGVLGEISRNDNAKVRDLLSRFNARRLSDVPKDRYEELLQAAQEVLKDVSRKQAGG